MWFRTIFRRNAQPQQGAEPVRTAELHLPPNLFTQLDRLRIRGSRRLRGNAAGQRPSSRRRPAADFREHRKYVAGDDIRFVDWKASARSEQVFLRQGELPQEANIHILLDGSASMGWGEPPKSQAAVNLAAALGFLALNGDDRLHVMPLVRAPEPESGRERIIFKGKGQYPALINALMRIPFQGQSDILETVRRLTAEHRGGIAILLSDLLDMPDLDAALALLPRPAWETVVLHMLHPLELQPALAGEIQLQDTESGAEASYDVGSRTIEDYQRHLESWRSGLEMACLARGAFYTLITSGLSLETETIPHLQRANVLEPA